MHPRTRQIICGAKPPNRNPFEEVHLRPSSAQSDTHSHGLSFSNVAFKDLVTNCLVFHGVEEEMKRKETRKVNYKHTSQELIFHLPFYVRLFAVLLMGVEVRKRENMSVSSRLGTPSIDTTLQRVTESQGGQSRCVFATRPVIIHLDKRSRTRVSHMRCLLKFCT